MEQMIEMKRAEELAFLVGKYETYVKYILLTTSEVAPATRELGEKLLRQSHAAFASPGAGLATAAFAGAIATALEENPEL